MDAKLRRELDAIARDNRSGASELALRATAALQKWLRRHPSPIEAELLAIAGSLLRAQPAMVPLWRLANDVAWSIDSADPRRALEEALARFRNVLETAPKQIAARFRRALPRPPRKAFVATYSYSSTVVRALVVGRSRIRQVYCSESRLGNEGRKTALKLAQAGIRVLFRTDAVFLDMAAVWNFVVLGADRIMPDGFSNKVGSDALLDRTRRTRWGRKARVVVLADTPKFWPEPDGGYSERKLVVRVKEGPRDQVWRNPPRNVWVFNYLFGFSRFVSSMAVLTEKGWMTPKQVRAELKKIRISPRLKTLVD